MEIKRDAYLKKLISRKHNGLIKVVTGIRRCGKSYLLFTLFKNYLMEHGIDQQHIIEIAFDSFKNERYRDPHVFYPFMEEQLKDDGLYYILLDEIQLSPNFVAGEMRFVCTLSALRNSCPFIQNRNMMAGTNTCFMAGCPLSSPIRKRSRKIHF